MDWDWVGARSNLLVIKLYFLRLVTFSFAICQTFNAFTLNRYRWILVHCQNPNIHNNCFTCCILLYKKYNWEVLKKNKNWQLFRFLVSCIVRAYFINNHPEQYEHNLRVPRMHHCYNIMLIHYHCQGCVLPCCIRTTINKGFMVHSKFEGKNIAIRSLLPHER